MRYNALYHARQPRPRGKLAHLPRFRIWPAGEPEAAVTVRSPFPETAMVEARRDHFGDDVELEHEEVR